MGMTWGWRSIVACAAACLWAAAAAAAGVTRDDVDRLIQPLVDNGYIHGVAVAVVTADGTHVYGYGRISDANRNPPAGDTIYEIGSVSKAFSGLLLAQMEGSGEVALDDPVQKHLPPGVELRQNGSPITLGHLTTHRSGLDRVPGNMKLDDMWNPYADYTQEQMYAFLRGRKPPRPPGAAYAYSNLGAGLLGHALSLRAEKR